MLMLRLSFLFCCLFSFRLSAQWVIAPYHPAPVQTATKKVLSLPFWDDFSYYSYSTQTDGARWTAQNVLVNNNLCIDPPTKGVATLDAFRSDGTTYDISSPTLKGYSDTLQSLSIDLSSYNAGSGLYLSFFWQAGGLGEAPDPEDFLVLQFLDDNGSWQEVWRRTGENNDSTTFTQTLIPIDQSRFLHSNFRFQFIRYGRLTGTFDYWHLDYVYLNSGRNSNDIYYRDISTVNRPLRYFAGFSAIPLHHLSAGFATTGKISTRLRNLDNNFRALTYQCRVYDSNNNVLLTLPVTAVAPNAPLIFPGDDFRLEATPSPIPVPAGPTTLRYCFEVNTSDDNTTIPPYDLRVNDTICGETVLDDYYAYDDGSFEYVAGINQRFGKLGVRFVLPGGLQAQLTAVDILFVPYKKDLTGQSFVLWVAKRLNAPAAADELLFQRAYPIEYPTSYGQVVRFPVDIYGTVMLSDTFYIGIQQTTDDFLAVAFDKDLDSHEHVFANVFGLWEQNPDIRGSLFIRPVFSPNPVTALTPPAEAVRLFPNPASEQVQVEGLTAPISACRLRDLQGRQHSCPWQGNRLFIGSLPPGFYVIELELSNGRRHLLKLIKQ
ncbi:T9SS type A sorting domain-containing protein [Thermonema rossianum]|uniref:T9SS type A sorting domain-containing protein n=1 Tax=Thermonema rossianum TaxID=55505 RepID=UPI00056FA850|nr:T9SS type A sorting domain-containing protein [Thermonema rossianum]